MTKTVKYLNSNKNSTNIQQNIQKRYNDSKLKSKQTCTRLIENIKIETIYPINNKHPTKTPNDDTRSRQDRQEEVIQKLLAPKTSKF